jgi:parallel beta-helix repeat protein
MKYQHRSILPVALATVIILVAGKSATAGTLCVDGGNASAADTNAGTAAQPFKTITAAVAKAKAGDVVEVKAGIYRGEHIAFTQGGTAEQPIVLRAAQGADVTIKGSEIVSDWQPVAGSTGVYEHAGWTMYFGKWTPAVVEYMKAGTPAPLNKYGGPVYDARNKARNQLFVDDAPLEEVPVRELLHAGSFFIDPASHTVALWLADGTDPKLHAIEMTDTDGPLLATAGKDHITLQGLSFEHCANPPQDTAAVCINGGSNCMVDHCKVSLAAGAGLSVTGKSHIVRQSIFNHNGQEGLHTSSDVHGRVELCETSFNNTLPGKEYDSGWEAGGNKFARSRGLTVVGHVSHDNNGPGIWFDVDNEDCTVDSCVCYNNEFGIFYEISYTGLFINNRSYNNRKTGIYISSSAGCRVYNNTTYGNGTFGISVETSIRGDGTPGRKISGYSNKIVNNIIADNQSVKNSKSYQPGLLGDSGKDLPAITGSFIPMEVNVSDYNLFYIANTQPFFIGPGKARPVTLKDWQAASGQDAHSIWGDPGFANATSGDFGLSSGSPAQGKGTPLSEVKTDALGTTRPADAPDIGAVEAKH